MISKLFNKCRCKWQAQTCTIMSVSQKVNKFLNANKNELRRRVRGLETDSQSCHPRQFNINLTYEILFHIITIVLGLPPPPAAEKLSIYLLWFGSFKSIAWAKRQTRHNRATLAGSDIHPHTPLTTPWDCQNKLQAIFLFSLSLFA